MKTKMVKVSVVIAMTVLMITTVGYVGQSLAVSPAKVTAPASELIPILVQDEGGLIEISIEDVLEYRGARCPMVMVVFRATELAISELWGGDIPRRSDFKIVSAAPVEGARDCFEFITRAITRPERKGDYKVVLPEGVKGFSLKNVVFTFTRKSTDQQIKIWVKEGVFPEGIFKLKSKIVSGQATMEEKKRFKSKMKETIGKLLKSPLDELFGFEKLKEARVVEIKKIKDEIKTEAEGEIVKYQEEGFYSDHDFLVILENKEEFKSQLIEKFKKEVIGVTAENCKVDLNQSKKSTLLKCNIVGARYSTNSYNMHFLLGNWPFCLYEFKEYEKKLVYDGKIDGVPTSIVFEFPYAYGHCCEHVWPK